MSPPLQRLAFRWLARPVTVPIADCVHFCAFRYGRNEFNPYENYAVKYARGDREGARAGFLEFLQHFRPTGLGAALGIELTRPVGLWQYPWMRRDSSGLNGRGARPGWHDDPAAVPDIITHFSEKGILRSRIEQEFGWLEQAVDSIRAHGYQPERFGRHIEVRRLVAKDGRAAYLVYDGNHRLSALVALGATEVVARYVPIMTVREAALDRWPQVAAGRCTREDAERIFHAYFSGRTSARTAASAAPLLT